MKSQRAYPVFFGIIILLSIVLCGIEGKKIASVNVNGTIQQIDKNSKFIVVNDKKVLIAPYTKIVDEKGNRLSKEDLKPKDNLEVDAIPLRDSYHANKITVKAPKKGP